MQIITKNYKFIVVFAITFLYYVLLCSKCYTWLYSSGDSGDWLAASNLWIVPQPYGSPLYILLGHFVNLLSTDLPATMTVLLSCLPSAITVALVYLITNKLTNRQSIAVISAVVLAGSAIFLTQSTILEEYAIAVMFTVLGYWFYLNGNKKLTALALGLGSAVHILVIIISVLWLALEWKNKREWLKTIPIYIVVGLLPYTLILWLLVHSDYPFLAGGLSLEALNHYFGSTTVFGSLSVYDLPKRLLDFASIMIASFGIALLAMWRGLKRKWEQHIKLLVIGIGFPIFYYMTCIDPTSWTFLTYASPFIAIACGLGLARINKAYFTNSVMAFSYLLLLVNSIFLDANTLSQNEKYDTAMDYYNELMSLSDGSAVVVNRGGFEGMALFYVISEGKDLIPVFYTVYQYEEDALYLNYVDWMRERYGIFGDNTQQMVYNILEEQNQVYILLPLMEKWKLAFDYENAGLEHFALITEVDKDVIVHTAENQYSTK
jgi:hypothetical protein